ncbi:DUF4386 domain-containing protein [Herpetosiphon llansteffanensis]|uniref:DUF4386 domain-containing protein n=1 Tax=Herpetosiphon llansteffanensis TaxID=2094568 RepID=UPI0013E01668|nr:DUF4386 domain-containing protein [Herpetosiphon llansteffanensis]
MIASNSYASINQTERSVTSTYRWAAGLLFGQFLIFMLTFLVLGSAIDWPASLDNPAAQALPLILQERSAVALGYTAYFLSATMLIPIALLLWHILGSESGLLRVSAGFGILAGFAKLLGIGRWLLLMPSLAEQYSATSDPNLRASIELLYTSFNNYAGGIGEQIGVAFFAGLWTAGVSLSILRQRQLPRWFGYSGLVVASSVLIPLIEVYNLSAGPMLMISNSLWQIWLITLGGLLLRYQPKVEV